MSACVGAWEMGGAKEEHVAVPRSEGVFNSPDCLCFCRLNMARFSSYPEPLKC